MANRKIEEKLERLTMLREADRSEATVALCAAIADRSNVVIAKAAKIAAELELHDLIPDLVRAFDRLFEKPVESDPQCWGKNAIAIALRDLGYQSAEPFVRGLRHIQMEPVWGGREDTAQVLRAACCAALPQCADLTRDEVLRHLVDAFTDASDRVRVDAARSIEHMGGADCALLLRLKSRVGDKEAHVTGQVFESLLRLERDRALPFVAEFLDSLDDDVCAEAALALGSSRLPEALTILKGASKRARDWNRKQVFLRGISASRLPEAIEFLLDLLKSGRQAEAAQALDALALHRDSAGIMRMIEEAILSKGENGFQEQFRRLFNSGPQPKP
jgi:HEAT repeat protein